MKEKVRILLGAIILAGMVVTVLLACQMTVEWWQAKPADDSGVVGLIWNQVGLFILLVWAVLLWLGCTIFGSKPRGNTSDTDCARKRR